MPELSELFDEFNQQFFGGRKPKYRVVFSNARDFGHFQGKCSQKRRLIQLRNGLSGDKLRQTLLHEMCHIGCTHHGKKFQARLQKLAEQGEVWALKEVEMYRDGLSYNQDTAMLRASLDEIAIASPQLTFRSLINHIAQDEGDTPAGVIRRYPWLKAAWRKAVANATAFKRISSAGKSAWLGL